MSNTFINLVPIYKYKLEINIWKSNKHKVNTADTEGIKCKCTTRQKLIKQKNT